MAAGISGTSFILFGTTEFLLPYDFLPSPYVCLSEQKITKNPRYGGLSF